MALVGYATAECDPDHRQHPGGLGSFSRIGVPCANPDPFIATTGLERRLPDRRPARPRSLIA